MKCNEWRKGNDKYIENNNKNKMKILFYWMWLLLWI